MIQNHSQAPFTLEIKADIVSSETGFDESDFNLLNYDFALSLLSSLSEVSDGKKTSRLLASCGLDSVIAFFL